VQVADIGGGLNAAIGILLALFHRQRTGEGQYVDISLMDSALGFMTVGLMLYGESGAIPLRGRMPLTGLFPFYNVYECADSKYFTLGALEPRFWETFCRAINRPDLVQDQFATGERGEAVENELQKMFKTKKRDEWFEKFFNLDICIGRVLEVDEMIEDPQVKDRRMVVKLEMPSGRKQNIQGIVVKLSNTPGDIRTRPAAFGEHTSEVLRELGYSDNDLKYCMEKGIC
jgi:crotonobetainyl-CoA:carnitine CoA-transferase CaiB-like acyl-CoA transferase